MNGYGYGFADEMQKKKNTMSIIPTVVERTAVILSTHRNM